MPLAPALRVPRAEAEAVRRRLVDEGRLRPDLRPRREGDAVVFPVTDALPEEEFEASHQLPRTYQDLLPDLPADVREALPSSFDAMGHVLVVKLPEEVRPFAREVAEALLAANPSARTVALDRGVRGAFRVRDLEVVAGEPSTETTHVENGLRLRVDPAKAYYSPRLATERRRVAELVQPGERVADLFAGVGPFALAIAKLARPASVDAVELNPDAHALLVENVRANKAVDVVRPHLADAASWAAAADRRGRFDRVVMNLPHGAAGFLEAAWGLLGVRGVVHHHVIASEAGLARHLDEVRVRAGLAGRTVEVGTVREVRTYSPEERHWAVDLAVA